MTPEKSEEGGRRGTRGGFAGKKKSRKGGKVKHAKVGAGTET